MTRTTHVRALVATLAVATIAAAVGAPAARSGAYDLGVRTFPQPLPGRFAKMPIRLWGAIGVPTGKGPFPVVLVGHGAATTGCPAKPSGDASVWPCWNVEQRNDLGMRYLVEGLARRGFVAVAPDVNAAFTDGWGEPLETLRYGQVLDATLAELTKANRGGTAFGRSLMGRLDLRRIGVVGHSRGGLQVVRWSARPGNRGRLRTLLLVEPTYDTAGPATPPDVPLTVVLGQCDGDAGLAGQSYYRAATRDTSRRAPDFKVLLLGANHAFFNATWTAKGQDDGPNATSRKCRVRRLPAATQRAWLAPVAADVLRQGFGLATAPWMRRGASFPDRLAGLPVAVDRLYPRR